MNLLAQNFDAIQSTGLSGYKLPSKVGPIITFILPYIFYGSAIGLLIYLVMGGLQLMTSMGDPKKIQGGKTKITNALVGFIIISLAFSFTYLAAKIFDIQPILNIFFVSGGANNSGVIGPIIN